MGTDGNCELKNMKFCKKLRETSWDKENKEYCCDNSYNDIKVCSFDNYTHKYSRINGFEGIKSVDALCRDQNSDRIFLIEFKNGTFNKYQVLQKVYDSIIILSKKLDKPVNYFVNNYTFVLVYNQDKLPSNIKCREKWLEVAAKKTNNKNYEIRFDLEKLKGYLCKEVITISKQEFNTL